MLKAGKTGSFCGRFKGLWENERDENCFGGRVKDFDLRRRNGKRNQMEKKGT